MPFFIIVAAAFSYDMPYQSVPKRPRFWFFPLSLLLPVFALSGIYAASGSKEKSGSEVPIREQVPLLLKTLPWDRNFQRRIKTGFHLGVLFTESDASKNALQDVVDLFSEWSAQRSNVAKNGRILAVQTHQLRWSSPAALAKAMDSQSLTAFYILPGNEDHLDEIIKIAEKRDVLTLSSVSEWVKRGLSVGLIRKKEDVEILINLKAARSEGANFSSKLLQIATVIK